MIHYYLQKGIMPDVIFKASELEKTFYKSSMLVKIEEEAESNS